MRQLLAVGRPNNPTNNSFQCKHQACKCDTRTIHDHAPTKYTTIQDVGMHQNNGYSRRSEIHQRFNQKGLNTCKIPIWGEIGPILGGKRALTLPLWAWSQQETTLHHSVESLITVRSCSKNLLTSSPGGGSDHRCSTAQLGVPSSELASGFSDGEPWYAMLMGARLSRRGLNAAR